MVTDDDMQEALANRPSTSPLFYDLDAHKREQRYREVADEWIQETLPKMKELRSSVPAPCVLKKGNFDFAWCETHDTTFPLGQTCEWNGVENIAEHILSKAEARLEEIAALHKQQGNICEQCKETFPCQTVLLCNTRIV